MANVVRTTLREPRMFHLHKNDRLARWRNRWLARQAWNELVASSPGAVYTADYAAGFKAGFADYLYAGGDGEPPLTPPRHYWNVDYDTPAGKEAICQWFAGFRHGAAVCREAGYRALAVVPSSVCAVPAEAAPHQQLELPLQTPELEIIQPAAEPLPAAAAGQQTPGEGAGKRVAVTAAVAAGNRHDKPHGNSARFE
jgi:hypothetical protein